MPIIRKAVPIWAITIYKIPALTDLSFSKSNMTRKNEIRDISSHDIRKTNIWDELTTMSIERIKPTERIHPRRIALFPYLPRIYPIEYISDGREITNINAINNKDKGSNSAQE